MGSWANSLQVKCDDAAAVVDAVRDILLGSGYQLETAQARRAERSGRRLAGVGAGSEERDDPWEDDWDDDSDDDDFGDLDPTDDGGVRRVKLYRPVRGWLGILDSKSLHGYDLAESLSARLSTDVLQLYVNDSDSWGYVLYRGGTSFDGFDSAGFEDDDLEGGFSPELQAAMDRGDEDEIERLMEQETLKYAPKGPIVLPDGSELIPPEMALLRERIVSGQASFREKWRYRRWWAGLLIRTLWGLFRGGSAARAGAASFGFDIPRAHALDAETLRAKLQLLAELFPAVDQKALRDLLQKSRFPAEDLLKNFLELVKLPSLYAYLSYDYLQDFGRAELRQDGIVEVAELRFAPSD